MTSTRLMTYRVAHVASKVLSFVKIDPYHIQKRGFAIVCVYGRCFLNPCKSEAIREIIINYTLYKK